MNEHEKALEAAKVIREYCNTRPNGACLNCIFMSTSNKEWGFDCVVGEADTPDRWNLTEAERKCND